MPRQENPLERDGTALVEFAADLRKLRDEAGKPPYREMARRAHFSSTTLSDAASGKRLPSLAVTVAFVRACGGNLAEWEARWHALAADLSDNTEEMDEPAEGSPYVGLAAYGPDDAELFFGRERLVEDIVARLGRQRFLAVFGPSGAGKSSVLRAGVVPELRKGRATVVLFTPGAHPLRECAMWLAPLLATTVLTVERDLATGPTALLSLTEQLLSTDLPNAEVVFVIDQFEEVFTLCQDKDERASFLALLLTASSTDSRCRVVLGVRADFYSHCAQHPELAAALQDAQVTVGPMTVDELRRAITQPARVAGCAVEGDLLSLLIAHAHGHAGSLPLLSHALLQTWRRRKGNTLTLAGFHATGGVDGALARTAETVFGTMTTVQQNITLHLFRRLIALGDGTEDTKRRVRRAELDDTPDTHAVVQRLGAARLLTLDRDTVEITHEALISAWPRLQRWLNADREGHRLHRELTDAAAIWQAHDHDPATLLRGNRLALLSDWADDNKGLTDLERRFLRASLAAHERERTSTRRQIRRQRVLIAVLTVFVVLAAAAFLFASNAQKTAFDQRNAALALRAAPVAVEMSNKDPEGAAKLALAAYRLYPSMETEDALIITSAALTDIEFKKLQGISHDARLLVASDRGEGKTTIFTIADDGMREESSVPLVRGDDKYVFPSISPDNTVLLSPDQGSEYTVWDISNPRAPVRAGSIPNVARINDWSPDSRRVTVTAPATLDHESSVINTWELSDLRKPTLVATLPGTDSWFAGTADLVASKTRMPGEFPHTDVLTVHKKSPVSNTFEPVATISTPGFGILDASFSSDGREATLLEATRDAVSKQAYLSTWRTDPARPAELIERNVSPRTAYIWFEAGLGGDYPPSVVTATDGRVALWDARAFPADAPILSVPTGSIVDMGFVHVSPSVNSVFLIKPDDEGKYKFRRLELSATKSATHACAKGVDTFSADIWAEHLPGVTPFRLCP